MPTVADTLTGFFRPGDRIAVAVSGGADSVALLLLLTDIAPVRGLQLSIAHFDHRWRPESSDDAAFVASLAAAHNVPFHFGQAGEAPPAANREHSARRARYGFFTGLVTAGEVDFVATAHTADDQAETILLRLLRGCGPSGLAGILPRRADGVVRPLLHVRRADLRAFLESRLQEWRDDASNADLRYRRNLLRHRFLPDLAATFNPALIPHLATLAALAQSENEFWEVYLAPLFSRLWRSAPNRGGEFDRQQLLAQPLAVQRRLLRRAVQLIQGDVRALDAVALEEILDWLASPSRHPRRRTLARCTCLISASKLTLTPVP